MAEQPDKIILDGASSAFPREKYPIALDHPAELAVSLCTKIIALAEEAGANTDIYFKEQVVDIVTDTIDAAYNEGYGERDASSN